MRIAIASGKGGTGKTTIATNLAYYLHKKQTVVLIDCDVEEPNCHLFLKPDWDFTYQATSPLPQIEQAKCTLCGKCSDFCHFGALSCLEDKILLFPELCHGCGGCTLICPFQAITEGQKDLGVIKSGQAKQIKLIQGHLNIGEPMAPPLIKQIKEKAPSGELIILDCPAGTSCPLIESLKNCDFVFLITEPTPFGLHDLKIVVEVVRDLNLPFAVGINRATLGDQAVKQYCQQEKIPIILEIPHERKIATAYSEGKLLLKQFPEYEKLFSPLLTSIREVINSCQN